jgi:transposase
MPKLGNYHLEDKELEIIEHAIRHDKRPEVRQRCTAIRLLHLGHKPSEVAKMQAVSDPTIYGWHKRWLAGGVEALADKPRSGRPLKSDDAYSLLVEAVVEKAPAELGYDFAIWTIDRLRSHLEKETGIDLSESRFRALLKRKGYRYRRPKHDLGHLQDKDAKAAAKEQLDELKKRHSETISGSSLWTKQP